MMGLTTLDKLKLEGSEHLAKKDKVLERLHSALVQTVDLVPTAAFRLQHIVVLRMPHRTCEKLWLALYVENMLRLESSSLSSALGGQMLSLIVDRLIEIDVEIRWEDIMREEDSNKVFMFHMNLDDDDILGGDEGYAVIDSSGPGCEAKQQQQTSESRRALLPTLDEMADKMDAIMDMTLEHLQTCVQNGHGDLIFETLMRCFQTTILDTYKSKFTQFLIFYMCSLAPATCGNTFANLLCDIFESKARPPNTRMSAAAYLASYLARASYLPLTVVVESMRRLLEWCVSYAQLAEDRRNLSMTTADPVLHGVFYCACQAVMYVLCYRLKDLTEDQRSKRVLRTLPLQELVEHYLKPLTVCLPSVVDEFVKQASIAQLVDCREWSYSRDASSSHAGGSFGGEGRLDMFFPFDPYLLKTSYRFIHPHFIQWSMVELPELYEDFSEEDDDFVNQTFSEPSSSWEDDSVSDMHEMAIASSIMGTADHTIAIEEDMGNEEFRDRHGNTDVVTTRGFDVDSFRNGNGSFRSAGLVESFLDHMSFSPPRELTRMPARLPAVLHPSLFT
jgi:RNA polymerase I-specific transcription initiation factor RRN3